AESLCDTIQHRRRQESWNRRALPQRTGDRPGWEAGLQRVLDERGVLIVSGEKSSEAERGQWHARVHTVSEDSYERLQLTDMTSPHWIVSCVSRGHVHTWNEGPERHMLAAHAGDVMIHPPQRAFSEHAEVPGTHLWMSLETTGEFDL